MKQQVPETLRAYWKKYNENLEKKKTEENLNEINESTGALDLNAASMNNSFDSNKTFDIDRENRKYFSAMSKEIENSRSVGRSQSEEEMDGELDIPEARVEEIVSSEEKEGRD